MLKFLYQRKYQESHAAAQIRHSRLSFRRPHASFHYIERTSQIPRVYAFGHRTEMGVSEGTVQRWESGNIRNMKYDNIVKLAELLDVTPAVLMGWQTEPAQNTQHQTEEVHTIAAHHDGTEWTEEELDEIEAFKKYILSKRKKK